MPAFQFLALDTSGTQQRGVIQADTPRAARASLRERGLTPLEIAPSEGIGGRGAGDAGVRLSSATLASLSRQLSTLVNSGLPIDESLQALAENGSARTKLSLTRLRARVMEGANLAFAMSEQPSTFPAFVRAAVAAGEASGKLGEVLVRLAGYLESRLATRQKIVIALTYPALLSIVALLVVAGLLIWVVPGVTEVFARQGQELPWATRALIAGSGALREHAIPLLMVAFVAAAALFALGRVEAAKRRWHRSLMSVPIAGALIRSVESARVARTLSLLVGSALPLLDALEIAGRAIGNLGVREALAQAAVRVREGQSLARALADFRVFPSVAVRLVAAGERSGQLGEMLHQVAENQERELDTVLGVATSILGPAVILIVGGLVLFIVLAILLPIFDLNTLVR